MGHPGTLPAINKKAVESVIMVGLALRSTIATYTEFDRKNYFYPDIPKGYQISQYAFPLVRGGELNGVAITRIHLEEDTARLAHRTDGTTVIDYNRAGVPLMELVTEPVIHDAKTASDFGRELQLLLRTLGVSDANMEEGQMRVEANISVIRTDQPAGELGTKVEVKNLNSFKSVEGAIAFEIARHIALLEEGGVVTQETRGWDEERQKTFSQRKKESAHDYRYFPDPDLPKIDLSVVDAFDISRLAENIPELPSNKRIKYKNLGLTSNQTEVLVTNLELGNFFEKTVAGAAPAVILLSANYLTSDVQGMLSSEQMWTDDQGVLVVEPKLDITSASPHTFRQLMELLDRKEITSRVAKDILKEVVFEGIDPSELISRRGLGQLGDDELSAVVDAVVADNPNVVLEYKAGKEASIQFLIGQGMRLTKGAGNPEILKELLTKRLS